METIYGPSTLKANRWFFIDGLRFVAVLLMIQGHTFDVLLSYDIRQQEWYRYHAFWHGFTAPLFLFGSGLAFGVATFSKWDQHLVWGEALRRRLRRYALLLALGYALHLPSFSLYRFWTLRATTAFTTALQTDTPWPGMQSPSY